MTPAEHYRRADELLTSYSGSGPSEYAIARAQAHATLATVTQPYDRPDVGPR